jgi:hypothetical protein
MKVYFYTLTDPRNPENIRYIGKTIQKLARRLDQHVSYTKRSIKNGKRSHNINWINSLLKEDIRPVISEIDCYECDDDSKDWIIFEKYWISQFKSWGFKLTNETDGGDGNQNQVFSKESQEKKAKKLRGVPRPKDVREKISKSHKGKIKTDEHIENIRKTIIAKQGRPINQYSLEGVFIKEWNSIASAADYFKIDRSSIMRCCQGKFKKSAGHVWKYKNEDIV